MDRIERAFVILCRIGTGAAFAVLIIAVLTQVIGRAAFNASPPWTEELTRYAMLWMIACAAGLSFRTGDLVGVDVFSEALPRPWPWRMRLLAALATAGVCAVLIEPAWRFTAVGSRQSSPVLGIGMNAVHASILALLVLLMLFALLRAAAMLLGGSDGRPVPNPDSQE